MVVDERSQAARDLLDVFGDISGNLKNFTIDLRENILVKKVICECAIQGYKGKYNSSTVIGCFVEAELKNACNVVWTLDLQWNNEKWMIDSSISGIYDVPESYHKIVVFPDKESNTLEACIFDLHESLKTLLGWDLRKILENDSDLYS